MAAVFLAEEIETGRQVALKMMQTRLEGTGRQRFTREFSTIASIKHPSCLEVYEYGESDTGPFFAMELFAGEPATALIGQPLAISLMALYHVAEAIDYIHSHRIIHRDIKPGNILVRSKSDESGFDVRLADFGLAKFANTSSSLSGETGFLGTVAYCAPEQITRDELDHRCDIYSFGLVCYEVLTGRYPYGDVRKNVQALVARQLRDMPPGIRSCNSDVDPAIDAAVMQMLSKDAGKRPQSTLTFRNAVAEYLDLTVKQDATERGSENRRLVGTFVARDQEKRLLDTLLAENLLLDGNTSDQWHEEQPALIGILTGPAGLGKSTLLRQVARTAMANGARVYEGRSQEGNLAPFQPFVEIIRQLLSEQEYLRVRVPSEQLVPQGKSAASSFTGQKSRVDEIIEEYSPEILRIAPELKNLLHGEAFSSAENTQQTDHMLRAIASFFSEISKIQRICLLIEDLHWADKSSLSLVAYLAAVIKTERQRAADRMAAVPRLFICATTRPEDDYATLAEALAQVREQRNQATIELQPFDEKNVSSMAAAMLGAVPEQIDSQLTQHITKQCLGNPFFVAQTIREFRKLGQITFNAGRWRLTANVDGALTESVQAALRERVRGLEPLPARILSVAAVIGAVVDVDLLNDVVGHSDQFEFLDALDLLLARQILTETGQARRVAFAHDLIREAATERHGSTQHTKRLHEAVARRLEQLVADGKSVSNAKLAEHFLSAEITDKAFCYLLKAGTEAVSAFAFPDALVLLEKALEIKPVGVDKKLELELYLQLATAYSAGSALVSAESMYREAIRAADCPLDRAKTLFGLGDTLARRRQPEEALKVFTTALREIRQPLRTDPISTVLDILAGIVFAFLLPNSVRRRLKLRSITQEDRNLAIQILLTMKHLSTDFSLVRYLQLSQVLFIRVHQSGLPEHLAMGHVTYATNFAFYGVPYLPLQYLNRAIGFATDSGNTQLEAYTATLGATVRGMTANLSDSLGQAERTLTVFERLGESYDRSVLTHFVRHHCEFYGDAKRELKYADEELRMAELSGDWEKLTWAHYGRASALARAGRLQESRYEMDQSFALVGNHISIISRPVAFVTDAFVRLQASEYPKAFDSAVAAQRLTERCLGVFLLVAKAYPLAVEAGLGPNWHLSEAHVELRSDRSRMRRISWVIWKCIIIGALFLVARAHGYRVRGRYAFVRGNAAQAVRLVNRAIAVADKQGSPYEKARALLDRSLICSESAGEDRSKGFALLKELGAVLPAAEQQAFESQPNGH
ncbi:MAG: protein kinase [Planctomycetaceae bacterium]|nr:protein kinase [Planctomycetaceae bacterium]